MSGRPTLLLLVPGPGSPHAWLQVQELLAQQPFVACLRQLLLLSPPYLRLLREAAWLLTFCSAAGNEAVARLVDQGVVPGLLCHVVGCAHQAVRVGLLVAREIGPIGTGLTTALCCLRHAHHLCSTVLCLACMHERAKVVARMQRLLMLMLPAGTPGGRGGCRRRAHAAQQGRRRQ